MDPSATSSCRGDQSDCLVSSARMSVRCRRALLACAGRLGASWPSRYASSQIAWTAISRRAALVIAVRRPATSAVRAVIPGRYLLCASAAIAAACKVCEHSLGARDYMPPVGFVLHCHTPNSHRATGLPKLTFSQLHKLKGSFAERAEQITQLGYVQAAISATKAIVQIPRCRMCGLRFLPSLIRTS